MTNRLADLLRSFSTTQNLSVDQIKQVRSYISTISSGVEQGIAKSTTTAAHVAEDQYIKPATPKPDNKRVLLLEAEQGPV